MRPRFHNVSNLSSSDIRRRIDSHRLAEVKATPDIVYTPEALTDPTKKSPLTHFLAIPLTNATSASQLSKSVSHFRSKLSGLDDLAQYADSRAVRQPGCLHLTLGVMSLTEEDLVRAQEVLQGWDWRAAFRRASEGQLTEQTKATASTDLVKPLVVSLKGLESMHARTKTSILFVDPTDPTDRLMGLCLELRQLFQDAGLLVKDERPLMLHVTVFNLKYVSKGASRSRGRADGRGGSRGRTSRAERFPNIDAFEIIRDMQNFEWATSVVLDRVAICKMGTSKVLDQAGQVMDEIYEEVFLLKFDRAALAVP